MTRTCRLALAASVAIGLLTTSCTGTHKSAAPSSSTPTPTPTSSTTTSPVPRPKGVNPFTGIGRVPVTPTIAVKIDDSAPGRPQVGIDAADIVYVEAVEGGLTRLAAIFGTNLPSAVGYVRSTRPSDPDLLLQFGKITEAYSGGAHDSLPRLRRSGITGWSYDGRAGYYTRVSRGQSPYINLVLDLKQVARKVKTPGPQNIGWTFGRSLGQLPASRGIDVRTTVTGSYPSGTPVEFRYDTSLKKYVRYIDGVRQFAADGKPVATTNVIVQSCRIVAHPVDTDINGNPSQFTYTVGKGAVSVFRQGKRINGTWSRSKVADGTVLRTAAGNAIPLYPGNTWVVLVRAGIPTSG